MKLCDSCETVSHCTAHGCIPLTECINSGQVSAAQVVAHAESGDFKPRLPKPAISTPFLSELKRVDQGDYYSAEQVHTLINVYNNLYLTALAAERAEVARLREALKELRLVVPYFWDDDNSHIEELDAACEKADEALK